MANYKESFDKVILAEGGYVNDPDDTGGETYLGITRVHHPNAKMFKLIDEVKKSFNGKFTNRQMTAKLKTMPEIVDEARSIYKTQYWDKVKLDEVPSDKLAHQIFDMAVNAGVSLAIKLAEELVGMKPTGKLTDTLITKLKVYGTE